jgi:fatty-acyl-CoA synthase
MNSPHVPASRAERSPVKMWLRALELTAPIERAPERTLPIVIDELAERWGHSPALTSPAGELSYSGLAAACHRYARWGLAQQLQPGEVVGLLLPNCPQYLAIWLGLTRIGVVVALLNPQLQGELLAHSINIVGARYVLFDGRLGAAIHGLRGRVSHAVQYWAVGAGDDTAPALDAAIACFASDAVTPRESQLPSLAHRALYIYTSGTTGLPKAANVSHFRLMQWSHWFAGLMDTQSSDRMYNCLPLYHSVGGVVATGATLLGGGCVVLRERFSASDFWSDIRLEGCTLFQYIGELCRYLVQRAPSEEEAQHRLRLCCGNGLRPEVWDEFTRRFQIPRILEYYAATEGSFSLYNCEQRPGSIGRIPAFLSHRMPVALVKIDEITGAPLRDAATGWCIRCAVNQPGEALGGLAESGTAGGGRFEGYADEAATERKVLRDVFAAGDAWYRTGDLMRQDEQGFYYFVDRLGDTYRWKGENVSTSEVEGVLTRCQGVLDAAVYGVSVPHSDGRAGMAALVVSNEFDLVRLREQLVEHLPDYARPLFIRIVPSMALTGTFKLRKQELLRLGYDPSVADDTLYVDQRERQRYLRLDAELFQQLQALGMSALRA